MKLIITVFITFLSISLFSCVDSTPTGLTPSTAATFIDTLPGSCPNLTKNANGAIVLSWVRKVNDSTEVFCYATSTDEGRSFGEAVVITPSYTVQPHAENLPKIIFKPSGEIIALWGTESRSTKNKYAGSISFAQSFDDGKTWSDAKPLVTDTAGYDQRYFDVSLLSNGEAAIIWLDNRKATELEGSALYFAITEGNNGFAGEKQIAAPTCQCCRTKLFVDSKNNIHAVYRGILQDSVRDMVHIVSIDSGNDFSAPQRISQDDWVIKACPHTGPTMTENSDGLHFSWYTGGKQEGTLYTNSKDYGHNFLQPLQIAKKGKHPQIAATGDGTLVTVWDENVKMGDSAFTRIGLHVQATKGQTSRKGFISPDNVHASYPVIAITKSQQPIISYSQKKNGKNYIAYQLLQL